MAPWVGLCVMEQVSPGAACHRRRPVAASLPAMGACLTGVMQERSNAPGISSTMPSITARYCNQVHLGVTCALHLASSTSTPPGEAYPCFTDLPPLLPNLPFQGWHLVCSEASACVRVFKTASTVPATHLLASATMFPHLPRQCSIHCRHSLLPRQRQRPTPPPPRGALQHGHVVL